MRPQGRKGNLLSTLLHLPFLLAKFFYLAACVHCLSLHIAFLAQEKLPYRGDAETQGTWLSWSIFGLQRFSWHPCPFLNDFAVFFVNCLTAQCQDFRTVCLPVVVSNQLMLISAIWTGETWILVETLLERVKAPIVGAGDSHSTAISHSAPRKHPNRHETHKTHELSSWLWQFCHTKANEIKLNPLMSDVCGF